MSTLRIGKSYIINWKIVLFHLSCVIFACIIQLSFYDINVRGMENKSYRALPQVSCWGHTAIFGVLVGMAENPLPASCFLFKCRTDSVQHLVKCHAFPKRHPTTNPTEVSGIEEGEEGFQ